MPIRKLLFLTLALFSLGGCQFLSSVLHDDSVVAKVGSHKLYKSEVVKLIPSGLTAEDSLQMALRYIHGWASDLVFQDVAEQQLSKEDQDVTEDLEAYRRSLLRYRYEQSYVAQRLSRDVSEEEVKAYYDSHLKNFILDLPIAKVRLLRISAESPHRESLRKLLVSADPDKLVALDSLSFSLADKYIDHGEQWMNLVDIGRIVGVDYGTILSKMSHNYAEVDDGNGRVSMVYFVDYMRSGLQAPLEFCTASIKETLISMRKRSLILSLEEELLEQARQNGDFVIYEDEK